MIPNLSNCQSTHKYHKSQPSLPYGPNVYQSSYEGINASSSQIFKTTAHDDKLFSHQRNNVRTTQANKCQCGKVGNNGDLNPYVHEDSNKKTCTNTTQSAEGKSRKVTQPPNVAQSYGTLSRICNERRGNKQNEYETNTIHTPSQKALKPLPAKALSDGTVETKQMSHNRNSNENAAERFALSFHYENRNDVGDKYRLFQGSAAINSARVEHLHVIGADESYGGVNNFMSPQAPSATAAISTELHNRDLSGNSEMPSTSSLTNVYSQQQHVPVSFTKNSTAPTTLMVAGGLSSTKFNVSPNSSVLFCRNNFDSYDKNDIKCKVDVNNIDQRCVVVECNHDVTVLMSEGIDHIVGNESAISNVKCFQSADKSSSEASGPNINTDNLIITSAIENLTMASIENKTPCKAKYSNDILTLREKRRRDRRNRRLARTRATNDVTLSSTTIEILPDIINNHLPPPYVDIPQQIVPSIVSTVPVEDNRLAFSLPSVRR